MKKLGLLFCLLFAFNALASPITVDVISAPDGVTIKNKNATLTLPTHQISEQLLSQSSTVSMSNKTFDQTSNVGLLFRGVYDISMGGATGANISLGSLPAKAIIRKALVQTVTAPVTLYDTPVISIGALNYTDILGATALTLGLRNGIQDWTAANDIQMAGASNVVMHISGGSLSAGQFVLFLDYVIGN